MSSALPMSVNDLLQRIKIAIAGELHDYPYPIAGCDEVFKTLVHQRECCRIALGGLAGQDGLTRDDAARAIAELLATPLALTRAERDSLGDVARREVAIG